MRNIENFPVAALNADGLEVGLPRDRMCLLSQTGRHRVPFHPRRTGREPYFRNSRRSRPVVSATPRTIMTR